MLLIKTCLALLALALLALLAYMVVHPELFGFFELAVMGAASVAFCAGIAGAANLEKETLAWLE